MKTIEINILSDDDEALVLNYLADLRDRKIISYQTSKLSLPKEPKTQESFDDMLIEALKGKKLSYEHARAKFI